MALNCLPRSPAECKGHYPVGTLALGSSGAARSTQKWNLKQKTQSHIFRWELRFMDSRETLKKPNADWLYKQLWKAKTSLSYRSKHPKPWGLLRLWTQGNRVPPLLLARHTHVSCLHCPEKYLSIFSFHMITPVGEISCVCMSTWKETNTKFWNWRPEDD